MKPDPEWITYRNFMIYAGSIAFLIWLFGWIASHG